MKARAIKDLCQLSQDSFMIEVSKGLDLILRNADNLINDAKLLLQNNSDDNGVWILRGIAEEEAAKILILIDAVRCPQDHERFTKHLENFNNHIAKGIYAEYYNLPFATFGDIAKFSEFYRSKYYLDGPEGIEWIFRNIVNQQREEMMYVDYIEEDEGHRWQAPDPVRMRGGKMYSHELVNNVISVSRDLRAVGCFTIAALSLLNEFWKNIKIDESLNWEEQRKLNEAFFLGMETKGLLKKNPGFLIDHWHSPIYSLDLSLIEVKKQDLRKIQEQWNPEY